MSGANSSFPRTSDFRSLLRRWDSGYLSRGPLSLAQVGPGLEVPQGHASTPTTPIPKLGN